jgi:hypothetical protein
MIAVLDMFSGMEPRSGAPLPRTASTARRRRRLVRSERVCSGEVCNATSPVTSWDSFVRDSLLQTAWPISLSADAESTDVVHGLLGRPNLVKPR